MVNERGKESMVNLLEQSLIVFIFPALCNATCENGGICVAPGVCECRRGFKGQACELDVDECSLGLHRCHPNSRCVNLPGWYTCHCLPGYTSLMPDNSQGLLCQGGG